MALENEVEGQMRKGRPKRTWKNQAEEENMKVGLISVMLSQSKWSVDVDLIATRVR